MSEPLTSPTWPIWLCGSITTFAALVVVALAALQLTDESSTHLVLARSIAVAAVAGFALADRGGSAVATTATLMTVLLLGDAVVHGLAGTYALAVASLLLATLTALAFVKMVRTCSIG